MIEPNEHVSKKSAVCFLTASIIISAIIPLFFIIIGTFNIFSCSSPILPLWLIGIAILIIIERVVSWRILISETQFENENPIPKTDDLKQIKSWEKSRMENTSKWLILGKNNLRILMFVG